MKKGTKFTALIQSVFASALGVQSSKNKERDFKDGQPAHFIIAGIIATLLFIGVLIVAVRVILHHVG